MELWLVLVRFVHYAASLVLFGLVLFPFYACPPTTSRDGGSRALAISLSVSLLVLASGILWFIGVATSMTGGGVNWETASFVLTDTSFGAVALLRLGATIAAIGGKGQCTFAAARKWVPAACLMWSRPLYGSEAHAAQRLRR
ncbi:hypothetical protein HZZ13_01100 [Bradyrhizobium sp. CNPSo 4010]|uniref:Copper resistance protein D n=1 Tax=Bradyrhizobium agreste TaxID=2751811 RepID=A0ABS0PGX6_9BRAD|nr:hypothetical protein [Bradyrhizobium agreste]MBH5396413.1 hypothetical protein [Bradyrhizobium agreste]